MPHFLIQQGDQTIGKERESKGLTTKISDGSVNYEVANIGLVSLGNLFLSFQKQLLSLLYAGKLPLLLSL